MDRRAFLLTTSAGAVAPAFLTAASEADLPFRQIHLDFHTNERIPDIGADFDPKEFAATLKEARVNSVNVFAKCHHGYAYYETKIATPHPHLKQDLLGGMAKACKAAGITVNYYYSLVWDVNVARKHPEWLCRNADGSVVGGGNTDQWPWVCMNTPYLDQVVAENEEILKKYEVAGSWFDILKQPPEGCFCKWCVADRKRLQLTDSAADVYAHNKQVAFKAEKALYALTHKHRPGAATFFNSRLVIGVRDELPYYSHIEIESLPTGGWGYSHFQQRVRYMRTLGKRVVGMTGRFHKSWGDFGGLKNQAALDYECLNFLANGTTVCVGDQLHPRGRLDATTYRRIGRTYAKVEALEPWAKGMKAVADIGVIATAATNPDMATKKLPAVDQGFTNMLMELHCQFDVLDLESDFSRYQVVMAPDEIRTSPKLVEIVSKYLKGGGALIASGESLTDTDLLGVRKLGPSKFEGEYMLLKPEHFAGIDDNGYFLYQRGLSIEALPGTEVLATYGHPYFNRRPDHYSSHKQTPMEKRTDEPLITRRGRIVYIANPMFRSYAEDGYGVYKLVVGELLRKLLPNPSIDAPGLASTAQVTLLAREDARVAHVLYYPLTRRAPDMDIIEESGLLERVRLRVRTPKKPSSVELVPQRTPVTFSYEAGYALFEIPRVEGHQAVAVNA